MSPRASRRRSGVLRRCSRSASTCPTTSERGSASSSTAPCCPPGPNPSRSGKSGGWAKPPSCCSTLAKPTGPRGSSPKGGRSPSGLGPMPASSSATSRPARAALTCPPRPSPLYCEPIPVSCSIATRAPTRAPPTGRTSKIATRLAATAEYSSPVRSHLGSSSAIHRGKWKDRAIDRSGALNPVDPRPTPGLAPAGQGLLR